MTRHTKKRRPERDTHTPFLYFWKKLEPALTKGSWPALAAKAKQSDTSKYQRQAICKEPVAQIPGTIIKTPRGWMVKTTKRK